MEKKPLDKKQKIFILVFPIFFAFLCYVAYINIFADKEPEVVSGSGEALIVPKVVAPVKDLDNKWDIYDRKDSIKSANERQKEQSGYDDFFETSVKKEALPEPPPVVASAPTSRIQLMPAEEEEVDIYQKSEKTAKRISSGAATKAPNPKKQFGFSEEQKKSMFGEEEVKPSESKPVPKEVEDEAPKRRSFYSASETGGTSNKAKSKHNDTDEHIYCVIHNDQNVKSGATVRLRITQDCRINGLDVPKNTYVSGKANFGNERLLIAVNSIKFGDQIVRTEMIAYEMDGIEGVYAPGTVNQEIAQQQAQQGAGSVSSSISVPLMGSISFGAKKKLADPTVRLLSGYKLLLKSKE